MTYVKLSFKTVFWVIYFQVWAVFLSVGLQMVVQTFAPSAFEFVVWRAFVYGHLIYSAVYGVAWLYARSLRTLKHFAWLWFGINGVGLITIIVLQSQAFEAWWLYGLIQHPYSVWLQTRPTPILIEDYVWMLVFFLSVAASLHVQTWVLERVVQHRERLAQRALAKQTPPNAK